MSASIALGVYLSLMPRVDRDGWWSQERGGYANHENAWSVGASVTYRFNDGELVLAHLGQASQFVAFTGDDANYNADNANGCNGDCEPTVWGYNHEHAQLVALSRVWQRRRVLFRAGGGFKRTTWTHARHESRDGDRAKTFTYRFTQTETALAPVLGVGYRFGEWQFMGQWVGDVYRVRSHGYTCCPRSREVYQLGVEK